MASTSTSSVHANDVEKNAGLNGHGPVHTHNGHAGHTGTSSASPAYMSQEGGAPLNLRNVTPGGHPLDRVRRVQSPLEREDAGQLTPFRLADTSVG